MKKNTVKPPRIEALNRVQARFRNREEFENLLCRKKFEEFYKRCKYADEVENPLPKDIITKRLNYIFRLKKFKQTQLAVKSGVHRCTLSDMLNSKAKTLSKCDTILQVIEGMEIDVYDFIDLEDDESTWEKVIFQKYFKYDAIGLEDIQVSYNAEHILKMIFETLEAKEIFYEMNGEKKYLNKETIEILRMGIYHSFDVVKYLLGDGT